jgi:hypothetical protein
MITVVCIALPSLAAVYAHLVVPQETDRADPVPNFPPLHLLAHVDNLPRSIRYRDEVVFYSVRSRILIYRNLQVTGVQADGTDLDHDLGRGGEFRLGDVIVQCQAGKVLAMGELVLAHDECELMTSLVAFDSGGSFMLNGQTHLSLAPYNLNSIPPAMVKEVRGDDESKGLHPDNFGS